MSVSIDQVVLYNLGGLNFACVYVVTNGVKMPVFRDLPCPDKPDAASMNALVMEVLASASTPSGFTIAGKPRARRRTKAEMEAARAGGEVISKEEEDDALIETAVAELNPAPVVAAPVVVEAAFSCYKRNNDNMRNAITKAFKALVPSMLLTKEKVAIVRQWQERLEAAQIPCILTQYVDVEVPEGVGAIHPDWTASVQKFVEAQPEHMPELS